MTIWTMKIGVANATPATYTPNVLFGVTHTLHSNATRGFLVYPQWS